MGLKHTKEKNFELDEYDIKYLLDTTNFTRQQIEEWHSGFLKDFPDGKLNKKKFIQIYKKSYPDGNPDAFCEHIFRAFDIDSNGSIDFTEFLLAVSVTSSKTDLKRKLEWMFRIYDINGDGMIDKKELLTIIDSIYRLLTDGSDPEDLKKKANEHTKEIFRKLEIDKRGKISITEFTDSCMKDQTLLKLLAPSS